jgi:hypothetical protein
MISRVTATAPPTGRRRTHHIAPNITPILTPMITPIVGVAIDPTATLTHRMIHTPAHGRRLRSGDRRGGGLLIRVSLLTTGQPNSNDGRYIRRRASNAVGL